MALMLFEKPGVLAEASLAGGALREVLEGVDGADWAPDGEQLAIVRGSRLEFPPGKTLYDSKQEVSPPFNGLLDIPRFAPDGKSIAFAEAQADGTLAISVVDLAGRRKILSQGWATTFGLAWHPKTREVWFSAADVSRPDAGGIVIHAVTLSGRHRIVSRQPPSLLLRDIAPDGRAFVDQAEFVETMRCLVPGAEAERDVTSRDFAQAADISDDGTLLLFGEGGSGNPRSSGVYLGKSDGSPPVRLGAGVPAGLSPDRKWVLALPAPADHLVLLPTGPGEPRTLPGGGRILRAAKWFPDGKRILVEGGPPGRAGRLFVQDAESGAVSELTPEQFEIGPISPDGRLVAAADPSGRVVLYPVEGGEPKEITGIEPGDRVLRFDGEGRSLYLARLDQTPMRIERLRLSDGRREHWRDLAPAGSAPGDAGSLYLTPDGRWYVYSTLRVLSHLYVVEGLE